MLDTFREAHVVVTGGTGALGQAVVAMLLERGAVCHVPTLRSPSEDPGLANRADLHYSTGVDLGREEAVSDFYARLPEPPRASIHLVGGF